MSIKSVGIDLGTTYSVVGVFKDNKVDIIINDQGERITPSLVSFNDEFRLIGGAAKNQAVVNSKNIISNVKRFIGKKFDDPQVQKDMCEWDQTIVCGKQDMPVFEVGFQNETKRFTPEQISAMILKHLKDRVEITLGYVVDNAVITVPAYFNDSQRQATKDAGTIAGFNVLGVLNEPTAAAITYGFDERRKGKKNILVYDLGGGTFDVTVLTINNGFFDVKATSGNVNLGGEDFDNKLVDFFAKQIMQKYKIDVKADTRSLRRLRAACELAKRNLSSKPQTTVVIDSFVNNEDFVQDINRARFEQLCEGMFNKTMSIVEEALKLAHMSVKDIDHVILVGGSTRIPKIKQLLSTFFNGKELTHSVNPDEAVAYGATIYAAMLLKNESEVIKTLTLEDVTPMSLGIELNGEVMGTLIAKNSKVPIKKTKKFETVQDYQDSAWIHVFEGEKTNVVGNNLLGSFLLTGIQVAKKGVSKVDVTFSIDANGILEVSAVDKKSGSTNSERIDQRKGRLSRTDINNMILDERRMKEKEELSIQQTVARDKLRNLLIDVQMYMENEEVTNEVGIAGAAKLNGVYLTTFKWFEENEKSASVAELRRKYDNLKTNCERLETVIRRKL